MNLFLDDIREPHKVTHVKLPYASWTVARNYNEFCKTISEYFAATGKLPNFISFDHDLSIEDAIGFEQNANHVGVEKTGYDCALWLVNFCLDNGLELPQYMVHSMNPVGRKNIECLLENFKKSCSLSQ